MADPIKTVVGDTAPDIRGTIIDLSTNAPVDVSNVSTIVRCHVRKVPDGAVTTITATKPNGGADGVINVAWTAGIFASAGDYEAELEITFNTGKVQTVPDKIKLQAREAIA